MPATLEHCPILAVEVTGPTRESPRDLDLSLAILSELIVSSDACISAREKGQFANYPAEAGAYLLFGTDRTGPLLCALELAEMLCEVPLMSVRIALHSGVVYEDGGATGAGIDEARRLLGTANPGQILISPGFADSLEPHELGSMLSARGVNASDRRLRVDPQNVVLLEAGDSSGLADALEAALLEDGHRIVRDTKTVGGIAWAQSVEAKIRAADVVLTVAPGSTADSELIQYELEIAADERRRRERPYLLPVWVGERPVSGSHLAALSANFRQISSRGEDTPSVVEEVRTALAAGSGEAEIDRLDTSGNATSGSSKFYVRRQADQIFEEALADQESIILVKGPRQIGKTTLLGRGVKLVDEKGWRCAATDFRMLSARQMESELSFYRVVVTTLCRQLGFDYDFDSEWLEGLSPIMNMDGFLRELLMASDLPFVWIMDEADRLFGTSFGADFFGLVRSWHNARATDPSGPWERLTIVIGYATEAHLFIQDLNKSPFNVGVTVGIDMFNLENTQDLNERYDRPISRVEDVEALHALLGGQPYLTRRALDVVTSGVMTVERLLADADREDGPFGDHLKRILISVSQLPSVWQALVESLGSPNLTDSNGLHRLIAANVLVRKPSGRFELPIELYKRYLARYVQPEVPS